MFDKFNTSSCSRENLKMILNHLNSKDISYDFDGNTGILEFDITELSEKAQNVIEKLLKRVNESKLESFIRKVVKEERRRINEEKFGFYIGDRVFIKDKKVTGKILDIEPDKSYRIGEITPKLKNGQTEIIISPTDVLKQRITHLDESSYQAELRDLATDLIDYLGGQLPAQGYTRNQRIMDYFRELGYKDNDPMIHKIYNLALKLKGNKT